jgi:hypothetical protein
VVAEAEASAADPEPEPTIGMATNCVNLDEVTCATEQVRSEARAFLQRAFFELPGGSAFGDLQPVARMAT